MDPAQIESLYPLDFRSADATTLGDHIRHRHIVELIGAKRIGISNFLRFFLYHKDIIPTYINHDEQHILIPVDLNDLIERTISSFWTVTFKRLVDSVTDERVQKTVQEKIANRFLASIQEKNLFLTVEAIRDSLIDITQLGIFPTLFFIRFDRLGDVPNRELFSNLHGIREATNHMVSYVFTSYRHLSEISPDSTSSDSLALRSAMFVKPAHAKDMRIIFNILEQRYELHLPKPMIEKLIYFSGGHVQYLQLALIILNEKYKYDLPQITAMQDILVSDERIALLSEEIWESLNEYEHHTLIKIHKQEELTPDDEKNASYLWESGIVHEEHNIHAVFSPLFDYAIQLKATRSKTDKSVEFTKKEHLLFLLLKESLGDICERELIIERVWPEYAVLGVSDWTIDRLIGRLRTKLKQQNSTYTVVTVKTRGFKLVTQ